MFAQRIAAAIQKAAPAPAAPTKGMMPPVQLMKGFAEGLKGMRFNKGGAVSSGRGDGAAVRGKTKCKMY